MQPTILQYPVWLGDKRDKQKENTHPNFKFQQLLRDLYHTPEIDDRSKSLDLTCLRIKCTLINRYLIKVPLFYGYVSIKSIKEFSPVDNRRPYIPSLDSNMYIIATFWQLIDWFKVQTFEFPFHEGFDKYNEEMATILRSFMIYLPNYVFISFPIEYWYTITYSMLMPQFLSRNDSFGVVTFQQQQEGDNLCKLFPDIYYKAIEEFKDLKDNYTYKAPLFTKGEEEPHIASALVLMRQTFISTNDTIRDHLKFILNQLKINDADLIETDNEFQLLNTSYPSSTLSILKRFFDPDDKGLLTIDKTDIDFTIYLPSIVDKFSVTNVVNVRPLSKIYEAIKVLLYRSTSMFIIAFPKPNNKDDDSIYLGGVTPDDDKDPIPFENKVHMLFNEYDLKERVIGLIQSIIDTDIESVSQVREQTPLKDLFKLSVIRSFQANLSPYLNYVKDGPYTRPLTAPLFKTIHSHMSFVLNSKRVNVKQYLYNDKTEDLNEISETEKAFFKLNMNNIERLIKQNIVIV